jgi:tetratricopeptide (TPR) repeat protein
MLAQKYLDRAYDLYKKKDYKKAYTDVEKILFFVPSDTAQLMNAGVFFAPLAGEDDKSIEYIKKYMAAGGKNPDAYIQLYQMYVKKKDTDSALKVAKELTARFPANIDYLNMEYNLYTQTNRLPEAKALMQKRAQADPNDKESRYFLGLISNEMKDRAETMKWMQEAVKIDPGYYEANLTIAKLIYVEAQDMRKERNAITGTKPADLAKRQELFQKIPVKLKESEPYWQKCLDAKPTEEEALYGIYSLYSDISTYDEKYEAKLTELKKKMKALGLEVD